MDKDRAASQFLYWEKPVKVNRDDICIDRSTRATRKQWVEYAILYLPSKV